MKYVVNVYGRQVPPVNDVNMPDAADICERLQHALQNKFPEDDFYYNHIDLDAGDNLTDHDENLIEQIEDGNLSHPLVTINDEIVGQGDVKADYVVRWLEQSG